MNGASEITLAAGELSATYQEGSLRYIRYAGVEVLRRIYFAVRDSDWRTIPVRIVREDITFDRQAFHVEFDAVHSEGPIEFRWTGHIRGYTSGVEFSAEGEAGSRFQKARIGLCVLHPGRACAGIPARITHTNGCVDNSEFPRLVSPWQPFLDVRAITHEPARGLEATVTFEGEVFETEDQRNWTDGSFKTYSTPLSQHFPVEVDSGWRVHHRVKCEVRQRILVTPRRDTQLVWPSIGTGASEAEVDLKKLGLRHVRVDVHGRDTQPLAQAARFGLPLEIAMYSPHLEDLVLIRDAALAARWEVARWIVYGVNADAARTVLKGEVGGGTDANFAELNRDRGIVKETSFAAFSLNPQVHNGDERTMIESLEGQGDAVTSALSFARQVIVSPVTLLPRFNAAAMTDGVTEPRADPRQGTPFVAAWTLGSLASLAAAGASSITYFEAAGPRGIAGTPVARLLAAIAEFAPRYAYACEVSAPLYVAAVAIGNKDEERVIVANLRSEPTGIAVTTARETIVTSLEPYAIRWIEN